VRRLVFASSNHTQAAGLFTSLDPAVAGGMCALRAGAPTKTLGMPAEPDGEPPPPRAGASLRAALSLNALENRRNRVYLCARLD
jgi:hypothetical protein